MVKIVKVKVIVGKVEGSFEKVFEEDKADEMIQKKEIILQILRMLFITNVKKKDISLILVRNHYQYQKMIIKIEHP